MLVWPFVFAAVTPTNCNETVNIGSAPGIVSKDDLATCYTSQLKKHDTRDESIFGYTYATVYGVILTIEI